jgi:hypothetical protein
VQLSAVSTKPRQPAHFLGWGELVAEQFSQYWPNILIRLNNLEMLAIPA